MSSQSIPAQVPAGSHKPFKAGGEQGGSCHLRPPNPTQGTRPSQLGVPRACQEGKEGKPQPLCGVSLREGDFSWMGIFPGWSRSLLTSRPGEGQRGHCAFTSQLARRGGTAQTALSPHQGCLGDSGVLCSCTQNLLWVFPSWVGLSWDEPIPGGMKGRCPLQPQELPLMCWDVPGSAQPGRMRESTREQPRDGKTPRVSPVPVN